MKKFLSIFLAIIMCVTAFPMAVFAEDAVAEEEAVVEASAQETVDAWLANYDTMLHILKDGTNYAHYKYVIDNSEQLQQDMAIYTAFGLYDNAWKNYFTGEINIDTCKQILMAMIEEYHYEMGVSYVDYFVEALEIASDVAGFIEDLNGFLDEYSDILNFVNAEEWCTTFKVVDYVIEAGHTWQTMRAGLIRAYSEIMSVQMANGYYVEMLEYVRDNTDYAPMKTAAMQLIYEATTAVENQILFFLDEATVDLRNQGIDALISCALNSNVYTATVYEIWGIGVSIADVLWNTSDQYEIFDALVGSYYAEVCLEEYAISAFDTMRSDYDPERSIFSVWSLLSVRHFGEETLYNLFVVMNEGIINKVKSKVFDWSCAEYAANMAALEMMEEALFNKTIDEMSPLKVCEYIYCPVNVLVYDGNELLFRVKDGEESTYDSVHGMAKSAYNAYNKEYVKVIFRASESFKTVMVGTDDGYVTYVREVVRNGETVDYSFTECAITPATKITVEGLSLNYTVSQDGLDMVYELNDEFVMPEAKEATWDTVTEATGEVVKEEVTSLWQKIKDFFNDLLAKIKAFFGIKDEPEDVVVDNASD